MSEATTVEQHGSAWTAWRRRIVLQDSALVIVLVALIVAGTFLKPGIFLTSSNLLTVLKQASVVGIVAIGMTFVIATGGIDLSVGSAIAASAIVGAKLGADNAFVFILATIAMALLIGAVNGLAVTVGRIAPFIATLAMLTIAHGLALRISGRTPITVTTGLTDWLGAGELLGIPVPALVFVILTFIAWILLNRTAFGRYAVAVGGNTEAARIAGIRVSRATLMTYVITGACVGLAAIVQTGRLQTSSPILGEGLELDAIAAVVIGGTSLAGGRATIVGTFLGVMTFALIFNLLNLLNLPSELQDIVKGVIILGAVALQRGRNR